ncbi:MAG TPA: hypothetical protein DDX39_06305 [Bacteroidales bacterium]|nr:MAG: hypothetical protein A2W98_00520 [Bacteroidetes bacterium GWF2_33_38]OFY71742.1 MAG: hypothetical protein A2265_02875 [Bacteroidetes bacterium RIFOXYA12_FULL_33_9]OFY90217.1 MAG: hypothetical protein A2236_02725 [Bacteroidetes bacterium RIFOXYA2_FULL_33_7]HBF88237.1 hypothetical protein [Bacteroidales bacterium]
MFRFEHPEYLYALALIPLLVLLYWLAAQIRKKALKRFGESNVISQLMPEISKSRPMLKFVFLIIGYIFLVLGIANPQIGSKLEEVKREGVELMIALDVSNSMMAEDIQPSRLERAKQAISKLVDRLSSDKIGLIIFAGQAYVQLPITTDYASAKMFLSMINTNMIPVQGTAIGKAIEMSMTSFSPDNDKNKAIVIITDGENHEDNAIEIASKATEKGIKVHTIGMGLPEGGPIPVVGKYGQRDFKTDREGNVVISKLDETMLQQIASAGGGIYIRANNTTVGLNTLFEELSKMEKTEFESEMYSDYEDRFQYFIAVALFFFLLDFIILNKKNKMFKNVNIFKVK